MPIFDNVLYATDGPLVKEVLCREQVVVYIKLVFCTRETWILILFVIWCNITG